MPKQKNTKGVVEVTFRYPIDLNSEFTDHGLITSVEEAMEQDKEEFKDLMVSAFMDEKIQIYLDFDDADSIKFKLIEASPE